MIKKTEAVPLLALMVLVSCADPVSDVPAPSGLGKVVAVADGGIGRATVSWPSVPGSEGYVLEWSPDPAFPPDQTTTVPGASSPFVLDNLDAGAQRFFGVAALSSKGQGGWGQTSVKLADSWTWSRLVGSQTVTTQDAQGFVVGNDFVVFITTHTVTVEGFEQLTRGKGGITWEGYAVTTDRVGGDVPPAVTRTSAFSKRGAATASGLTLTEADSDSGWVALNPGESHTWVPNADGSRLVVDGDTSKPFLFLP